MYLRQSKPNAAVRDCNAALSLNQDSAKALKCRGKAYRMLGDYELALRDLSDAQRIDFDEGIEEMLRFVSDRVKSIQAKRQRRAKATAAARAEAEKAASSSAMPDMGGMGGIPGLGGMPDMGGIPGLGGMGTARVPGGRQADFSHHTRRLQALQR